MPLARLCCLDYFNSHAHVERDFVKAIADIILIDFNSHAHVERDLIKCEHFSVERYFNSHAHVERDIYPY